MCRPARHLSRRQEFFARFLQKKTHINKIVDGRELAVAAAYDYFESTRDEFERKNG
jgi:hypothetical protein